VNGNIDTFFRKIHRIVRQAKINLQLTMLIEKLWEQRSDMMDAKGHSRMDSQGSTRREMKLGDRRIRFFYIPQNPFELLEIEISCFRERELAARPVEQPHAQFILQAIDHPEDRGRRYTDLPASGGKTPRLNDAGKQTHTCKNIHQEAFSLFKKILSRFHPLSTISIRNKSLCSDLSGSQQGFLLSRPPPPAVEEKQK
jgi:hypothetical protein